MRKQKVLFSLIGIIITLLIFSSGALAGYYLPAQLTPIISTAYSKLPFSKDEPSVTFLMEIYDKIKSEYWEDLSDEQLVDFYIQAIRRQQLQVDIQIKNKQELVNALDKIIKRVESSQRKGFATGVTSAVLANLRPPGRSLLYSQKQETALKNLVQNINPDKDLYKDVGADKGTSKEKIEEIARVKEQKLIQEKQLAKTPEQKKDIEKKIDTIKYAKEVLTAPEKKQRYDTYGIEPTVFTRLITKDVLHLHIKKMSPTTFDEFKKAVETFDKEGGPTSLIFNLTGNIGGSLDIVPLLTGAFLGNNQYAFDLYRKGKPEVIRTKIDKLPGLLRYKQVVILVDENGQSSAEITAVVLKRYKIGILLGKKTKGWGTIEQLYPLKAQIDPNEKYSIFLVNHITLRDDGEPIEGRGVEPNISLDDSNWDKELFGYYNNTVVGAVKDILNTN